MVALRREHLTSQRTGQWQVPTGAVISLLTTIGSNQPAPDVQFATSNVS